MQALQKQRLKQLAVCFQSWSAEAKQGQVHLRGAASMLQWRKLLRIWKVIVNFSRISEAPWLALKLQHGSTCNMSHHRIFTQGYMDMDCKAAPWALFPMLSSFTISAVLNVRGRELVVAEHRSTCLA